MQNSLGLLLLDSTVIKLLFSRYNYNKHSTEKLKGLQYYMYCSLKVYA